MKSRLLLAFVLAFLLSGCGESVLTNPFPSSSGSSKQLGKTVATGPQLQIDSLAEDLYQNLRDKGGVSNPNGKVIIISTFVDSNDFDKTNRLGRLVSEQLIAGLFNYGFKIVEFRATRKLQLKKTEGEFALSREIEKLKRSYDARYMVLGTYTDAAKSVFINARLIDLEDAHVISASSHEVLKTSEILYLMEDGKESEVDSEKPKENELLTPSSHER